ncbi:MAG: glycoside hydrolase family 108 protein [Vampirovibrionales bacterium]
MPVTTGGYHRAGQPLALRSGFQLPQGLGQAVARSQHQLGAWVSQAQQGLTQVVRGLFAPVRQMVNQVSHPPQGRWWFVSSTGGRQLGGLLQPPSSQRQASSSVLGQIEQAFETALKPVLKWEGGFSNHPNDTGGATNMGITHEVYRQWLSKKGLPQKNVKDITKEEVRQIYYENYWVPSGANQLAQRNLPLAVAVFNAAVNMGVGRAKDILQKAGNSHVTFLQEMENLYRRFASRGGQGVFLQGWLNRNRDIMQYTQALSGQSGFSAMSS